MISKKKLAVTAFALLMSQQSFASEKPGFYIGGSSYGQFFNNAGTLKVEGDNVKNVTINDRTAEATEGQVISKYKANYDPPFAASIKFGYEGEFKDNDYRAELEVMRSLVKVDNIGLINGPIVMMYDKSPNRYGLPINHDQVENTSAMANVYHYWKNDRFSFSPYVGVGVGLTRMTIFEKASIRPAYQLKAGLDYRLTEDTHLHVGYRHFGAAGADIELTTKKLGTLSGSNFTPSKQEAADEEIIHTGNKLFSTHGIEVGLTVHFGSKA
jgi:opacity protein-like surface antigen